MTLFYNNFVYTLQFTKNMKTKKILALILILVGLGFSFSAKAQCTYSMTNNTNCTFTVDITYDDGLGFVIVTRIIVPGANLLTTPSPCIVIRSLLVYDGGAGISNAYVDATTTTDNVGGCTPAQVYLVQWFSSSSWSIN